MDEKYMRRAIELAIEATSLDEVPVGAVIVRNGEIIAEAHNMKETKNTATRHAEIEAIEVASKVVGNWYLDECELYCTLEPCPMCAGAIINARLKALYYGAHDNKAGCVGSVCNLFADGLFNHKPIIEGGILAEECGKLLSDYFRSKRNKA